MSNEQTKDFNAMLHDNKDMPKIKTIADVKSIAKYGGTKMLLAPPIAYDKVMRQIPKGKLVIINSIRDYLADKHGADFTDPLTAGIFVSIVAWASEQRTSDITPYWRTLKKDGELNPKYPGGQEKQKELLEAEGHSVIAKGKKNIRYFVDGFENKLVDVRQLR